MVGALERRALERKSVRYGGRGGAEQCQYNCLFVVESKYTSGTSFVSWGIVACGLQISLNPLSPF